MQVITRMIGCLLVTAALFFAGCKQSNEPQPAAAPEPNAAIPAAPTAPETPAAPAAPIIPEGNKPAAMPSSDQPTPVQTTDGNMPADGNTPAQPPADGNTPAK